MEVIRHFPLPYRDRGKAKQQDPGGVPRGEAH